MSVISNYVTNEIELKEKQLKEDFEILEEQTIHSVPEVIFVRDFLPAFSGKEQMSKELLQIWYSISDGPFNYVNILNKNGNIVAKVPPIKIRGILPTNDDDGIDSSMSAIYQQHQALSAISPVAADNKLTHMLHAKFVKGSKSANTDKIAQEWNDLIAKYSGSLPNSVNKEEALSLKKAGPSIDMSDSTFE
jgi:hypothetical protein